MWQWLRETGKNINTCRCCKAEEEEDEDPNSGQPKPRHSPNGQVIPNGPNTNMYIVPHTTTANAFSTPSSFNPPPPLTSDRVFRPGGGGSSPTVGAGAIPDQGFLLMEALSQLAKKDPSEYTRKVVETPEEKVGKKSKSHVATGLFIVNGANSEIPVAEKREPMPSHSTNNVTPYNPPPVEMAQAPSWVSDPIRMGSHAVLRTNTPHNGYDAVNPINLHFGELSNTRFAQQSSGIWDPHAGTPSVTPQYQDPNLAYSVGNMNVYGINPRDMAAEITLIDSSSPHPEGF